MSISQKTNPLTLEERQALGSLLENSVVMGALEKVWTNHAEYYANLADNESLADDPLTNKLIQYTSRKAQLREMSKLIREAMQR